MKRPFRAVSKASTRLRAETVSAVSSSTSKLLRNVGQLRLSAIEPLPQVERMPLLLRELEWQNKVDDRPDPAAIVRRLRGRQSTQEDSNELGCAYALLAWERSLDAYWLLAIAELREAAARNDLDSKSKAERNLERVAAVSGFPA